MSVHAWFWFMSFCSSQLLSLSSKSLMIIKRRPPIKTPRSTLIHTKLFTATPKGLFRPRDDKRPNSVRFLIKTFKESRMNPLDDTSENVKNDKMSEI